ncbi:MAG: Hsp70 family protein [Deltaproteobacteria bacterium]|nr:Hsp70 family protein [Deltaproteobacteria bacterium]
MATTGDRPRQIGIDLGTTNTLAAWTDGRVPRVIPTEKGGNLLPSVVAFAGERVMIGQPAKEQLLINPADTIYGSKRLVGRPFHSTQVQSLAKRFPYEIVEGDRGLCAVKAGGRVHDLAEISTIILEQIARYAAAHLGGPVEGAVISVPADYPLTQRDAVRKAARAAGLDVWRLVNEPTAAALAYGLSRNLDQKILVFDLGGGTFDVSILEIGGGTFNVLATGGDSTLGGVDFDIRLCDHLIERFEADEDLSIRDEAVVVQRVLNAAELAKIDLSLLQHAEVRLPFVTQRRGKPVDLAMHVSRQQLVQLTEDLIERCARTVDEVLAHAGLTHAAIDEILLAGGQTRMPAIQARLEKQFGRPPKKGVNPDEVVAQGAALLARSLSGGGEVRLLDVISLPVGIGRRSATGVSFEPVLARNATLPAQGVVEVSTLVDGQSAIEVDLFQGLSRDVKAADYLGTVKMDVPPGPAGARAMTLTVHVDAEGLLDVRGVAPGAPARRLPVVAKHPTLRMDAPPAHLSDASSGSIPIPRPVQGTAAAKPGLLQRLFKR